MATNPKYIPIFTTIGLNKIIAALGSGNKITLDKFAVGDANGTDYTPAANMTTLVNELAKIDLRTIWYTDFSDGSRTLLEITALLKSGVVTATIKEIGIYDTAGDLIIVARTPDRETVSTDNFAININYTTQISIDNDKRVFAVSQNPLKDFATIEEYNGHATNLNNPHQLTKAQIELGNVDNTADNAKNVLSATKLFTTRLINNVPFNGTADITIYDNTKLPLAGGTLTGALTGISFNSITGLANFIPAADGIGAIGTSTLVSRADHIHPSDNTKASLESPSFTGTVTLPAATTIGNISSVELNYLDGVTSSIQTQLNNRLPLTGGTLTGALSGVSFNSITGLSNVTPAANGTAAIGTSTLAARADHVHPNSGGGLSADSPAFTGTPTAPTATAGTNTTQLATTAFVTTAVANVTSGLLTGNVALPATTTIGTVTAAEIAYLSGVTSSIQTQLNNRLPLSGGTLTGALNGTNFNGITGLSSTTPIANGTATIGTATTAARADHIHPSDTTKASLASPTFTGTVVLPATTSIGTVTSTELGYLSGITSSIQTQLNSKAGLATVAPSGDGTATVGTSTLAARQDHIHPTDTTLLAKSGGTMTGTLQLKGATETAVALGTGSAIDLSLGTVFSKTVTATTTFTVSNVAPTGLVSSFILELTNGGSQTIAYFSGVKWSAGSAPTLTTAGVDILGFYTTDGGTTWRGSVLSSDSK